MNRLKQNLKKKNQNKFEKRDSFFFTKFMGRRIEFQIKNLKFAQNLF